VLRRRAATHFARAVLVVSHHLDGFLLHGLRRLVASCCRPWDSPCFRRSRCHASQRVRSGFLYGATPSRAFPSRVALPRVAAGPCPLAVARLASDPTSRPCSTRESVAPSLRCR
jgi:hypothetical protein